MVFYFASIFVIRFIAHGYVFSNLTLSHDSLNKFYPFDLINYADYSVFMHKVVLKRFFYSDISVDIQGKPTLPWLTRLLYLLWTVIAVYVTAKLFNIKSKLKIILISFFIFQTSQL